VKKVDYGVSVMNVYEDLYSQLLEWKKIDTHEHFFPQNHFQESPDILFSIFKDSYLPWILYGARDLSSVAFTREDVLRGIKKIPGSAFYRYLMQAFAYMYDFNDEFLTEENWDGLSRFIKDQYSQYDMLERWIFQKLNVQRVVLDRYWVIGDFDIDSRYFSPVLRIDPLFYGFSQAALDHDQMNPRLWAENSGISIETFDEYLSYVDYLFEKGNAQGICAVKCAIAYDRTLRFETIDRDRAQVAFYRADGSESKDEIKNFQDYIFHYCLQKANEYQLPVQIHTGPGKAFQTAASHLGNIFEEYHQLKISLFHGSFPWVGEPGAMALFYPNLYLDLVWLPVMSPTYALLALSEWIETTGGSRIMMGGDSWNAEGAVGSILYYLNTIAKVLADKVENNYFSRTTAEDIGRMILWDNPRDFFGERIERKIPKE